MRQKSAPAGVSRANIRVDRSNRIPAYRQITQQVRALVATGALRRGDRLPTVRQVAAEVGINFNTVARAYRILDWAGVISTQHGRGTYVVGPPQRGRRSRTQFLDGLAAAYLAEAEASGFPAEAALEAVARRAARKPATRSARFHVKQGG